MRKQFETIFAFYFVFCLFFAHKCYVQLSMVISYPYTNRIPKLWSRHVISHVLPSSSIENHKVGIWYSLYWSWYHKDSTCAHLIWYGSLADGDNDGEHSDAADHMLHIQEIFINDRQDDEHRQDGARKEGYIPEDEIKMWTH